MAAIQELVDRVRGFSDSVSRGLRERLLGAHNERLDFLMDSFYKLQPPQRNALLAGVVGIIVCFVLGAVSLYFIQANALRTELEDAFTALADVRALKQEEQVVSDQFDRLVDTVRKRTASLAMKPFFEKISQDHKVTLRDINEKMVERVSGDPLAARLSEVQVSLKVRKVSIPRLLKFLVAIEKSNQFLRVQSLRLSADFSNKLYFEAEVEVRGYKVIG